MLNYRLTAILIPGLMLGLLPAFAAYPWQMPMGGDLALPFLTLATIVFCALRYPGLIPSPLIFLSGLACDLFTRSPLGFWSLLFLLAQFCGSAGNALARNFIVLNSGRWLVAACFGVTLLASMLAAWGLASLYQSEWQNFLTMVEGMAVALLLLPLPLLVLISFENLLIFRTPEHNAPSYIPKAR
jgi:hypothetical protein